MKIQCPKCAQRIEISPEVAAALAGTETFDCPTCGEAVPTPSAEEDSLPPLAAEQLLMRGINSTNPNGNDWIPPEAEELDEQIDDRYKIASMLGHGGMGAVYKARDTRLDRTVAIKILPEELANNPAILSRFEREAKSLAALDHPNIVKIHDYGFTTGGSPFFVMEFVRGNDIQSLRKQGDLDLTTALTMISQVCDAIAYAHERKIIHRDIKPANVMVNERGMTKVADFGLAKLLETDTRPHHEPDLTITGQAMGTPAFMAPEQESGASVDHRTDIYALGVMLYNLLTGTPPRGAWSLPSELADVDIRLDQIVLRALQEDPAARYQFATDFRNDIESVIGDSGGAALPPGTEPHPLPSTVGNGHPTTSRRFANKSRTTITLDAPSTQHAETEFLSTTRSLNNTMLILGLLAMSVIGGLALYLANRKTGDVNSVSQTITTSETTNTFFSQLIATGIASSAELSEVSVIRPYGTGFIGLSKETLTENGARALAEDTGAEILELPVIPRQEIHPPLAWLRENLTAEETARVIRDGKFHLFDGDSLLPAADSTSRHRVLLQWLPNESKKKPSPPVETAPQPEITPPVPNPPDSPRERAREVPTPDEIPAPPEPEDTDPVIDTGTDVQNRDRQAIFLRVEGGNLIIDFKGKETPVPLSRLSPESRALAMKRRAEAQPKEPKP